MVVTVMLLALAAPNPAMINAPRKAYSECIKRFEDKSVAAKMDFTAYTGALKGACGSEAAALARVLVDYDVAMGGKRASAAASADSDIADYRLNSEERYRDMMPQSSRTATASAAAPAVAPPAAKGAVQKVDASAPR